MSKDEEDINYESLVGVKKKDKANIAEFLGIDDAEKEWQKHWVGMPEFEQEENPPYKQIYVSFRTKEDYDEFAKMIGQPLTEKTKSIWHPKLDRTKNSLLRWMEDDEPE